MNRSLRTLALVLAAGALAAPVARAQQPRPGQPQQQVRIPPGGTEMFRALLDVEGVQPIKATEAGGHRKSSRTIVVIIGNPNQAGNIDPFDYARDVLRSGGAVLIATDSFLWLSNQNWFGVGQITGNKARADWRDCYERNNNAPFVVPVSPAELTPPVEKPGRVWDVFRGLNRVATNAPSYLFVNQFAGEYQYVVARLPKSTYPSWSNPRDVFAVPPPFAVGGDGQPNARTGEPGYSFLAVADSSVYINDSLVLEDADNLTFTLKTIEYLQGPDKYRTRCAFFENGRLVENFDGLKQALYQPPEKKNPDQMPDIGSLFGKNQDKLVDLVNGLADSLQERDGLHNMVVGRPGTTAEQRAFGSWIERAVVLACVAITLFLLRRAWRARHPLDVPPAPTTGAGTAPTGPPGVFDRRQKELVRRNNLFEPVRAMMREFFDSVGAPEKPGPRLPTLEISRAVRKPDSLRQAIRDMWRIAYGPPVPISAQRWFELEPYFERLKQAHAEGKWRFATGETLPLE